MAESLESTVVALHISAVRDEIAKWEREVKQRYWLANPDKWAEERLGVTLWSGQRRIMRAVANNRRTAVASCHEASKTHTAALLSAWWLDCHFPGEAFVITSAPTDPQVRAVLWREIGRLHARGRLPGRVNQTEWHMKMPKGNEELVAMGRKPSDYSPTAFQGIHARYVLVILDEACGIVSVLWEAADSLIANDDSKQLAIGNPDDPQSEFKKVCTPGSGYHVEHIGAFDTPNFTGEALPASIKAHLIGRVYVEERRRKWAPGWRWAEDGSKCIPPPNYKIEESHPFWQSKILGRFPAITGVSNLIPMAWIIAAQQRTLPALGVSELALDVGAGGDESTCGWRRGPRFRILWDSKNPDTMQTCGEFVATLREPSFEIARGKVDMIGIGRGVVDRAKELHRLGELEIPVEGINDGEGAINAKEYLNRRAEDWWMIRTMFERGEIDIDPDDEELAGELASLRYKRTSQGKIQVESKQDARARGVSSPNRADTLKIAYAEPREETGGPMQIVPLAGFH